MPINVTYSLDKTLTHIEKELFKTTGFILDANQKPTDTKFKLRIVEVADYHFNKDKDSDDICELLVVIFGVIKGMAPDNDKSFTHVINYGDIKADYNIKRSTLFEILTNMQVTVEHNNGESGVYVDLYLDDGKYIAQSIKIYNNADALSIEMDDCRFSYTVDRDLEELYKKSAG